MSNKKSISKKVLVVIGIIVIIIVACALVLRGILNSDSFKEKIKQAAVQAVADELGMQLVFNNEFQVSLFPSPALFVQGISLAPLKDKQPAIALKSLSIDRAEAVVGLWSLISGNPRVRVVSLQDMAMALPARAVLEHEVDIRLTSLTLSDFSLQQGGGLQLNGQMAWPGNQVDADISLTIQLQGDKRAVIDINDMALQAALADRQPARVRGQAQIDLTGNKPLTDIKSIQDIASIKLDKLSLAIDDLSLNAQLALENMQGQLNLQAQGSARGLLRFLGYEFASATAGRSLNLALDMAGKDNVWEINKLDAGLDDMALRLTGQYRQGLQLRGSLDLASLQVEDYLLKPLPSGQEQTPDSQSASGGQPAPGQTAPATLPAGLSNVRLAISAARLAYGQLALSNLKATLQAEKGVWRLQPLLADFQGGNINTELAADFNHVPPRLSGKGNANGMLLKGSGLSGQIKSASFNLNSQAGEKLLNTLNGALAFNAQDISSEKITLPAPLGNLSPVISTASASFNIHNGIATTSDLLAAGPQVKLSGQGNVNLPRQSLNMDVLVNMANVSIRGVDSIPLKVSGSFSQPRIEIDAARLAESAARGIIKEQLGESVLPPGVGNFLQGIGR